MPTKKDQPQLELTAKHFVKRLEALRSPQTAKSHEHLAADKKDKLMGGVRMGHIFALAKEFIDMPLKEVEKLLDNPFHETRVGAVSIMDFQARNKKTMEQRKKELFNLYIRRHDRINTWDLVDRSAPYVVGGYLFDKKRDALYKLARSKKMPERRTSIVSTGYFIRQSDVADTFKIAEILLQDQEDLIHKAAGWMLRAAGDVERKKLLAFLDKHAVTMPRTMLRYATEKLDKKQHEYYLNLKKGERPKKKTNTHFSSIDEYIANFPEKSQRALKEIRATIKTLVPQAEEYISYNMPAFKVNGEYFVHFSAWKNHIGMYPIPAGNEAFQKEVLKYQSAKSSLSFPLDKPMPLKFIEKVIKFRITENLKNAKLKASNGR